jgi:1-deoxy-D-xylulose-5-phosphate reductoisomerase
MTESRTRLAVFGSTGSIGRSTLDVAKKHPHRIEVVALSAHSRWSELAMQVRSVQPRWAVLTGSEHSISLASEGIPPNTELQFGSKPLDEIARHPEVDAVLVAIVGSAGLLSTWAAVDAGKKVALANKETLVVAGQEIMALAQRRGANIIPVDSEHSAIFQALHAGKKAEVKRLILTASGGPFRGFSPAQLRDVTVQQALAHPIWDMGPKITVDSATMMNKALELIEARWLFDMPPEKIEIVVHPQSIVHSLVEFVDGSVIAQLSCPDMRIPIQYALSYPDRWEGAETQWNFADCAALTFEPPDLDAFPAIMLGMQVARDGGTSGVVLNAANEAAVQGFIDGELRFSEITEVCRSVLEHHDYSHHPTLEQLLELDAWARKEVTRWVLT